MQSSEPHVLLASKHRPYQWLNGKGTALEIARYPPGDEDFDWKVSIAEITDSGPFSVMPGMDRWLVPLTEGGLTLVQDEERTLLEPFEVHKFRGEAVVSSIDVHYPSRDLNLITRRNKCLGWLELVTASNPTFISTHITVIISISGFVSLGHQTLTTLDAIVLRAGESASLTGSGTFAVASIAPSEQTPPG